MNRSFLRQGYDLSNPDYVEANQGGRIHPDQKALLGSSIGRLFLRPVKAGGRQSPLAIVAVVIFLGIFAIVKLFETDLAMEYKYSGVAIFVLILLAGIAYWAYRRFTKNRLGKELERGLIRQGSGELTFGRRGYEVKVKGQRLKLPFGGAGTLSPGVEYRFYYLPQSGMALSAEQLTTMDDRRARENLTGILAQANRFKLDVLEKNRQGAMAVKQIPHLFSGTFAALLFIVVLLYFLQPVYRPYFVRQNWSDMPTVAIVVGLIFGGVVLYAAYLLINSLLDLVQMRVLSVDGVGHPFTRTSNSGESRSIYYYYQIGDRKFKVTKKAYLALLGGLRYRAYYTPHRKKLVNIEAIESPLSETAQRGDFDERLQNHPGIRVPRK